MTQELATEMLEGATEDTALMDVLRAGDAAVREITELLVGHEAAPEQSPPQPKLGAAAAAVDVLSGLVAQSTAAVRMLTADSALADGGVAARRACSRLREGMAGVMRDVLEVAAGCEPLVQAAEELRCVLSLPVSGGGVVSPLSSLPELGEPD